MLGTQQDVCDVLLYEIEQTRKLPFMGLFRRREVTRHSLLYRADDDRVYLRKSVNGKTVAENHTKTSIEKSFLIIESIANRIESIHGFQSPVHFRGSMIKRFDIRTHSKDLCLYIQLNSRNVGLEPEPVAKKEPVQGMLLRK